VEIKFKNPKLAVAALKAVLTHASEDATRPHIHGVYFDLHPASLDIVATDGDCLALYRFLSAEYESDHFVGGVTVPLASCLAATKSKPGKSFSIETGPSGCRLTNGDVSIVFTPVDVQFPPYGQILPNQLEDTIPLLAASYLARAANAFQSVGKARGKKGGVPVCVRGSGNLSPYVIASEEVPEMLIVVIPIRTRRLESAPGDLRSNTSRLPFSSAE
jgi:hypothetical protein